MASAPNVMHIGSDAGSDISGMPSNDVGTGQVVREGVQAQGLPAAHPVE